MGLLSRNKLFQLRRGKANSPPVGTFLKGSISDEQEDGLHFQMGYQWEKMHFTTGILQTRPAEEKKAVGYRYISN